MGQWRQKLVGKEQRGKVASLDPLLCSPRMSIVRLVRDLGSDDMRDIMDLSQKSPNHISCANLSMDKIISSEKELRLVIPGRSATREVKLFCANWMKWNRWVLLGCNVRSVFILSSPLSLKNCPFSMDDLQVLALPGRGSYRKTQGGTEYEDNRSLEIVLLRKRPLWG